MMGPFRKLREDERGAVMIMVAVALVTCFAFAVLAIDISLIELAKTQLQNAADAAAIAGALRYGETNGSQLEATARAIQLAGMNRAVQTTQQPVNITAADVTFPPDYKIRVQTHRTEGTGDPVQLYFLRVINAASSNLGNMTAHAVAQVVSIEGSNCLRPWMFPDRWEDANNDGIYQRPESLLVDLNGNGSYDLGDSFIDANKNGVWDAGEFYDPDVTGYNATRDVGTQITLFYDNGGGALTPREGWYQAVRFGPVNRGGPDCTGADCYREWIYGCEPYLVMPGDTLQMETGGMVGPTNQGLDSLIGLDPNATYDPIGDTIMNSNPLCDCTESPRLIKVAVYNPRVGVIQYGGTGATKNLLVAKIVVVFIERRQGGGNIYARFMRMAAPGEYGEPGTGGFMYSAHLVE